MKRLLSRRRHPPSKKQQNRPNPKGRAKQPHNLLILDRQSFHSTERELERIAKMQSDDDEPLGLTGLTGLELESDDDGDNEKRFIVSQKVQGAKKENDRYKEHSYWEERFTEEESFEWLLGFQQCKNQLLPHLRPDDRILIVGCGNSSFSADLYDAGYQNIVNIDYSGVVIERMKALHSESRPRMTWQEMDMTKMTFEPESFDVVIDKAAMDALVVSEGDVWDPYPEVIENVDKMCFCVSSVLKSSDSKFLQISFNQPHFRTKYLMGYRAESSANLGHGSHTGKCERYNWSLSFESIILAEEGVLETFFYVMIR